MTATEVRVALRRPPQAIFDRLAASAAELLPLSPRSRADGDRARRAGEDSGPDDGRFDVELFMYDEKGDEMQAYERLLGDALAATRRCSRARTRSRPRGAIVDPILVAMRRRCTATAAARGARPRPRQDRRRARRLVQPAAYAQAERATTMTADRRLFLVGDVGATNARLAIATCARTRSNGSTRRTVPMSTSRRFDAAIDAFFAQSSVERER